MSNFYIYISYSIDSIFIFLYNYFRTIVYIENLRIKINHFELRELHKLLNLIINGPRYKFAINCVKINGAHGMIKISQIVNSARIRYRWRQLSKVGDSYVYKPRWNCSLSSFIILTSYQTYREYNRSGLETWIGWTKAIC